MSFPSAERTRRSNAQQKVRRYCTCGRKFIGNPAWTSHQAWANRNDVGTEHVYAGTMPTEKYLRSKP